MRKQLSILIFFTSFALAITAYNNSTFLNDYMDERFVGMVFTVSSCVTLILLELLPYLIRILGMKKLGLLLFLIGILSGMGLGFLVVKGLKILSIILLLFILFISSNTSLPFIFDVIAITENEKSAMGSIRGLFITLTNLAWMLSPILAVTLITRYGFGVLFILSGILLLFGGILFALRKFEIKTTFERPSLFSLIKELKQNSDIFRVVLLNFLLQLFYGTMVIFMPLYLHTHIGLSLQTISILFTIMLIPFLLLSIPLGKVADAWLGEKELLVFGFSVMGIATIASGLYFGIVTLIWGIILFSTRIGAATVEEMLDTYFFKKIEGRDTSLISIYRSMSPVGYMIGPLVASGLTFIAPTYSIFILLGSCLLLAIPIIILPIHDTK